MNNSLSNVRFAREVSTRQQLSRQLREMILSGEMAEGDKLPSNQVLSEKWQVAASSIQAAMASLVKEGLLQRARKRGTFVAKRSRALTHVGIYLSDDIWHMREASFRRALVGSLGTQLRKRNIEPDIWTDSRPKSEQANPWPALVQAAEQRQIQAVMFCSGVGEHLKWLSRMPVPIISLSSFTQKAVVHVDVPAGTRLAVQELQRQGCKSVGIIAPYSARPRLADGRENPHAHHILAFRQCALELGLELEDEWLPGLDDLVHESNAEHYGYEAMKRILSLPRRPDGIFVTYDWVARGAVMAVLESQISVPSQLKLVLHRNVGAGFLCPVPASFLDFSTEHIADTMIDIMDSELRGDECGVVQVSPQITTM